MNATIFNDALEKALAGQKAEKIVDPKSKLTVSRQCELLGVPRSSYYYKPVVRSKVVDEEREAVMAEVDRIHTEHPYYGARKISKDLAKAGYENWGRNRVAKLMDDMRIFPVYPKPNLSKHTKQSAKFPYLLKGKKIWLPNQVWAADITYVRLGTGHMYLTAFIDWYTRMIVGWELSDSLEAATVVSCMKRATETYGVPAISNSDQGAQFGSEAYVTLLAELGVRQSMDGRRRWVDNVRIERWFRSLKSECLYINEYNTPRELKNLIAEYVEDYNNKRLHEALDYATPAECYYAAFGNAA